MKNFRNLSTKILCLVAFFGVGCLQTRQQIRDGVSMGDANPAAVESTQAGQSQKQRAQIDSRFFEIDRDFRQLYGKIEALEGRMEQMGSGAGTLEGAQEDSEKIKSLEARITTLEEAILSLDKRLGKRKSAARQGSAAAPGIVGTLPRGDFQKGEHYLVQKDCVNAIESFDKYRKRYPNGKYYSNATFNMGECFRKLNLPKDAKAFYQEVLQNFPETKVAKRAQTRLSQVQ